MEKTLPTLKGSARFYHLVACIPFSQRISWLEINPTNRIKRRCYIGKVTFKDANTFRWYIDRISA